MKNFTEATGSMETPFLRTPLGEIKLIIGETVLPLTEEDLLIIKESLSLRVKINLGGICEACRYLPLDYNKHYNSHSWNDWRMVVDIIRQLVSQFTIENVDGWYSGLSVHSPHISPTTTRAYELSESLHNLTSGGVDDPPPTCAILDEANNS
jgi:hypothetical protein